MVRVARLLAVLGVLAVSACSDPLPPAGRWQGAYEDSQLMVVARLEIDLAGAVRVSAPNAIADLAALSENERGAIRERLENGLARAWPSVTTLPLEFDGHAFHKPGGVAPQLEWDEGRMTMIFYSNNRPSVRIPLSQVTQFGAS